MMTMPQHLPTTEVTRQVLAALNACQPVRPLLEPLAAQLIPAWEGAARRRDAAAQWLLGLTYLLGVARPACPRMAQEHLTAAAEAGYAAAMYELAMLLLHNPVAATDDEAWRWLSAAAERGIVPAMVELGLALIEAEHRAGDPVQGVAWLEKASALGNLRATLALAACHADGNGVPLDEARAFALYERAAQQGHAGAQCLLGLCYDAGIGTAPDPAKAFAAYRRAADNHDPEAAYLVGMCYAEGLGTESDPQQALQWLERAEQRGYPAAAAAKARLMEQQGHADALSELRRMVLRSGACTNGGECGTVPSPLALMEAIDGLEVNELNALLRDLALVLGVDTPEISGFSAVAVAILVESGASPNLIAEPFFANLERILRTAHAGSAERRLPLDLWCRSAVTVVTKDAELRRRFVSPALVAPLAALRSTYDGAELLWRVLNTPLDEHLLILIPRVNQGFEVRLSGFTDLAQLQIGLAQRLARPSMAGYLSAVMAPTAEACEVALLASPVHTRAEVPAAFDFFRWDALRCDGSLPPQREAAYLLPDHLALSAVPSFRGTRILLAEPNAKRLLQLKRHLPEVEPHLILRTRLDEEGVQAWVAKLTCAAERG